MSKDGRKFFYFNTSFFADKKIKILKARYGSDGLIVYIYLLCEIYRGEGYYLQSDDDFEYVISDDLGMNYQKIGQILNFLLERSLFDNTLFKSDKVLTSRKIQLTFQEAVKGKAVKNPVIVDERLWLLKKEETATFIKVRHENADSDNLTRNSENFNDNSKNLDAKQSKGNTKESKAKQSKAVVSAADTAFAAYCEKIEQSYFSATGKKLSNADKRTISDLHSKGYSADLIASVIDDVANRKHSGKINSFNYFLPAVQEALNSDNNANDGRYPPTYDSQAIEDILNAEWMAEGVGRDSDYNYDD